MTKQVDGLDTLVPPLDLCRKIPEGMFEDSVLVWCKEHEMLFVDYADRTGERRESEVWRVRPMNAATRRHKRKQGMEIYPAPTAGELIRYSPTLSGEVEVYACYEGDLLEHLLDNLDVR